MCIDTAKNQVLYPVTRVPWYSSSRTQTARRLATTEATEAAPSHSLTAAPRAARFLSYYSYSSTLCSTLRATSLRIGKQHSLRTGLPHRAAARSKLSRRRELVSRWRTEMSSRCNMRPAYRTRICGGVCSRAGVICQRAWNIKPRRCAVRRRVR